MIIYQYKSRYDLYNLSQIKLVFTLKFYYYSFKNLLVYELI